MNNKMQWQILSLTQFLNLDFNIFSDKNKNFNNYFS